MKFLRKFYRWSLLILIPLLMGSSIRGCSNLLQEFFFQLCLIGGNSDTVGFEYADESCYNLQDFNTQYIFVSFVGKIWHGEAIFDCFSDIYEDIVPPINSDLNRIEYFADLNLLIVVGDDGTILREDEPSQINEWDLINSPTSNNLTGLCLSGSSIFAAGDTGTVIKSEDQGLTWELLNFPFNVDLNDCSSPADGEVICVGSSYFAAYRTTDYGDTWEQINFGDLVPESVKSEQGAGLQRIYCFDNNISYIVGTGFVFRTNDNWNSYEFQDPGTTEQLNDVFFVAPDTGVIIGNNGIARFTSDGGQNWFDDPDVTTALNGTSLKRIKKEADNDFGYIVGEGGLSIAFARDSSAFTPVEDEQQIVTEYSLSQNYPNPFNPSTKINYSIPQFGLVTLKVYDLLGNEIATLVNEEKNADNYQVDFSGEDLPSGIYFCKITAGNYSGNKKISVVEIIF